MEEKARPRSRQEAPPRTPSLPMRYRYFELQACKTDKRIRPLDGSSTEENLTLLAGEMMAPGRGMATC